MRKLCVQWTGRMFAMGLVFGVAATCLGVEMPAQCGCGYGGCETGCCDTGCWGSSGGAWVDMRTGRAVTGCPLLHCLSCMDPACEPSQSCWGEKQACGHVRRVSHKAEVGYFNCNCRGSYKFPVPPQYTYHWPGMYSQQTMTEYTSPYRFPSLKQPQWDE